MLMLQNIEKASTPRKAQRVHRKTSDEQVRKSACLARDV